MMMRKSENFGSHWMALGILSLCIVVATSLVAAASDILLVEAVGQVEIRSSQSTSWEEISEDRMLHFGDSIRTGPKSLAKIHFESGMVMLHENTILEIPAEPDHQRISRDSEGLRNLFLEKGRSLFKIFKDRLTGEFEVITPSLIAGVKGTTFHVFEEEEMKGVIVSEGIVEVNNRQFQYEVLEVTADQFTLLLDDHLMAIREFRDEPALFFEEAHELRKRLMDLRQDHPRLHEGLQDQQRERLTDFRGKEEDLISDLHGHQRELADDLKDEHQDLISDLRDDHKDLMSDLKDQHKT